MTAHTHSELTFCWAHRCSASSALLTPTTHCLVCVAVRKRGIKWRRTASPLSTKQYFIKYTYLLTNVIGFSFQASSSVNVQINLAMLLLHYIRVFSFLLCYYLFISYQFCLRWLKDWDPCSFVIRCPQGATVLWISIQPTDTHLCSLFGLLMNWVRLHCV